MIKKNDILVLVILPNPTQTKQTHVTNLPPKSSSSMIPLKHKKNEKKNKNKNKLNVGCAHWDK